MTDRGTSIAGVALCCLSAALVALVAVLLTPFYIGSALIPIAVVVAIAGNIAVALIARSLTSSTWVASLPLVVWIAAVIVLSLPRPEGDVLLPGGKTGQTAVSYGVVLAGVLTGILTLALSSPQRRALVGREVSSRSL